MSDEDKNQRNKPLKNPEKFPVKVLLIWAGLFLLLAMLMQLKGVPAHDSRTWTINEVVAAAGEGRVMEGRIKSKPSGGRNWMRIEGIIKDEKTGDESRFVTEANLTDDTLEKLQATGSFREVPAGTFWQQILLTFLPIALLIALVYFLFVRQLKQAGRGAMSFGKSRAKMLTRDHDRVTFDDVAGCDEAKEEVSEVVEFLKDPKKFQRIGGRIPKGVLLVGPPGTGKTLLARAVAGEADVPFFTISGSDFVEMFVGVGAARVRDMFEQGRKNAPCIIFIDEIDAVGRQRGAGLGGGNDEREQTLNSLLVEMDGFDAHEGVIIMAATNRPDVLDNALLRPGRFDRQIVIDLPDRVGREEILKVHVKKIKADESVKLGTVARNTPGFSGADLANLLNEAALLAARYGKDSVEMQDIDEAREKIAFGRERRKLMDDDDKKITAYHEAGHALVQAIVDDGHLPVHKVTIIPRGQSLGSTMFMPKKDILNHTQKRLLSQICCGMGGRVAEELVFDDITSGASGDIRMATKIARHMVCDWGMSDLGPVAYGDNQDHIFIGKEIARDQNYSEETAQKIDSAIRRVIDAEYLRATKIIKEYEKALHTIAEALLEFETIEGKHVQEIIEHGEIRSPVLHQPSMLGGSKEEDSPKSKRSSEEDEPEEGLGPDAQPAGVPA